MDYIKELLHSLQLMASTFDNNTNYFFKDFLTNQVTSGLQVFFGLKLFRMTSTVADVI